MKEYLENRLLEINDFISSSKDNGNSFSRFVASRDGNKHNAIIELNSRASELKRALQYLSELKKC